MALEDFIKKRNTIQDNFKVVAKEQPEIIKKTMSYGIDAVNTDWMPFLLESEELKEYHSYIRSKGTMNIYERGYRFEFARSRQNAGVCFGGVDTRIAISIDFIKGDNNWEHINMRDTIRHEIAHAIVNILFKNSMLFNIDEIDPKHKITQGHGDLFFKVCRAINKDGNCNQHVANMEKNKFFKLYKGKCRKCGYENYSDESKPGQCTVCKSVVSYVKN